MDDTLQGCWNCGQDHWLSEYTSLNEDEKKEVDARKRKVSVAKRLPRLSEARAKNRMFSFEVDNGKVITIPACPEKGVTDTVIPDSLVETLVNAGVELYVNNISSRSTAWEMQKYSETVAKR